MTRHIPPRAARDHEMRRLDASHVALTQGSKCRAAWQGGDVYFDAVVTRVNEDGSMPCRTRMGQATLMQDFIIASSNI